MITYSPMTLHDLYNICMLRLEKFYNGVNVDFATFTTIANRSIKSVVSRTLPYRSWAYTNVAYLRDGETIPANYLGRITVMYSGWGEKVEARYAHPAEYFSFAYRSSTAPNHYSGTFNWNEAQPFQPVYTIWGNSDVLKLYIYGLHHTTAQIRFKYYGMPDIITNPLDLLPIPNEYNVLLVLETLSRILFKVGNQNDAQTLYKQLQDSVQAVAKNVIELKKNKEAEKERSQTVFEEQYAPVREAANILEGVLTR